MRTWDVIVIGGGIIGLSLALALRKRGAKVLVVERGEPGREASYAAGGMLVEASAETPAVLQPLVTASAGMHPEFARELQVESGIDPDMRDFGAIVFPAADPSHAPGSALPAPLSELEPALAANNRPAFFLSERSVDPRALTHAAYGACRHLGVDFSSGDEVTEVLSSNGHASGARTVKTSFHAEKIVNCAGAWAGQIPPSRFPTRPVKGQMLCLAAPSRSFLKHVIRTPDVYIIPRSDGRILVGASVEEAGFDKRTDPEVMKNFHRHALDLIPTLHDAKILEDWAGLRPGTPDALPILGATDTPGYFVATGHFRDGILLAPVTAQIMADVISGRDCGFDLAPFLASRFWLGGGGPPVR